MHLLFFPNIYHINNNTFNLSSKNKKKNHLKYKTSFSKLTYKINILNSFINHI